MIKLSLSPTDISPVNTTVLHSRPTGKQLLPDEINVDLLLKMRNKLRGYITAATGELYTDLISFNNIYYDVFPAKYSVVPAIVTISKDNEAYIIINKELASIDDTNSLLINKYEDLAACLLYGISYIIAFNIDDVQILTRMYDGAVLYVYSLLLRIYGRQAGLYQLEPIRVITLYITVAKLILNTFFDASPTLQNLQYTTVLNFLKTYKNKDLTTLNRVKDLINNINNITNWSEFLNVLNELEIIQSQTLADLRMRIVSVGGGYLLYALSSGVPFVSMLSAARVSASFIPVSIKNINSKAFHKVNDALNEEVYKFIER